MLRYCKDSIPARDTSYTQPTPEEMKASLPGDPKSRFEFRSPEELQHALQRHCEGSKRLLLRELTL